jgi:hypothetical protein
MERNLNKAYVGVMTHNESEYAFMLYVSIRQAKLVWKPSHLNYTH